MIGPVNRFLPLLLLTGALLGPSPRSAAGGDAGENGRAPGRITLSDGTVYEGAIRTTDGKPFRVVEGGRRLDLAIPEIHRITVHVTMEEEYRIWRWVEDGSREKVYTGESYPRREYEVEVLLKTGQVHRGKTTAVLYCYVEGKKKPAKAILRKEERGEIGEKLTDLVYVESVEFEGEAPDATPAGCSIELTVSPPGALVTAHALPRERDRSVEMVKSRTPGRAVFPDLLPGTYDLAVVTEKAIYLSLAVGADGGKPLDEQTLLDLEGRVAEIADFFDKREVIEAVRDGEKIRAVVRKFRAGGSTLDSGGAFRRWEIWSMHRGGDRWLVDNRSYLWREHGEALGAARDVVLTAELGAIHVESGVAKREFRVPAGGGR